MPLPAGSLGWPRYQIAATPLIHSRYEATVSLFVCLPQYLALFSAVSSIPVSADSGHHLAPVTPYHKVKPSTDCLDLSLQSVLENTV